MDRFNAKSLHSYMAKPVSSKSDVKLGELLAKVVSDSNPGVRAAAKEVWKKFAQSCLVGVGREESVRLLNRYFGFFKLILCFVFFQFYFLSFDCLFSFIYFCQNFRNNVEQTIQISIRYWNMKKNENKKTQILRPGLSRCNIGFGENENDLKISI